MNANYSHMRVKPVSVLSKVEMTVSTEKWLHLQINDNSNGEIVLLKISFLSSMKKTLAQNRDNLTMIISPYLWSFFNDKSVFVTFYEVISACWVGEHSMLSGSLAGECPPILAWGYPCYCCFNLFWFLFSIILLLCKIVLLKLYYNNRPINP